MDKAEARKAADQALAKAGIKASAQNKVLEVVIEGTCARMTTSTPGVNITQK